MHTIEKKKRKVHSKLRSRTTYDVLASQLVWISFTLISVHHFISLCFPFFAFFSLLITTLFSSGWRVKVTQQQHHKKKKEITFDYFGSAAISYTSNFFLLESQWGTSTSTTNKIKKESHQNSQSLLIEMKWWIILKCSTQRPYISWWRHLFLRRGFLFWIFSVKIYSFFALLNKHLFWNKIQRVRVRPP